MTQEQLRVALENAVGIPEQALRDAVANAAELAPSVIAAAHRMADGVLPLPHEERLLHFGLYALAVARDTTACPVFLALLRSPPLEVYWLFGEDRSATIARLLLGLFDGDAAAVCALAADRQVESDARAALLSALARLVWEGRASREAVVDLLDRIDRDEQEDQESFMWFGWQHAIMLLGLPDWIERVDRALQAGRVVPMFQREVDRNDWLERARAAVDHPEDPQHFIDDQLVPFDDPVSGLEWSAAPPGGPDDALNEDELAWLDLALWRRITANPGTTMSLEQADGYLTALAAGPVRVPVADALPSIWGTDATQPRFGTPEHDAYVAALLTRHFAAIERDLAAGTAIDPWIDHDLDDLRGALWTTGYAAGVEQCSDAWQPLIRTKRLAGHLLLPFIALSPGLDALVDEPVSPQRRWELVRLLPDIVAATWAYWQGSDHPLLDVPRERAVKVGRNDPCPCGSGKKYKRCCGAVA